MTFPGRVLTAAAILGGALLLWMVRDLMLLVFGGVVFAVVLASLARLLRRWLPIGPRASIAASVALVIAMMVGLAFWLGNELAAQIKDLSDRLPRAIEALRGWVAESALGAQLIEQLETLQGDGVPWRKVATAAGVTLGALGDFILMLLLAVFLAAEPALYRNGVLRLLPVQHRGSVGEALDRCAHALRGWLKGQGISMIFVGATTALGLWLLGVPLALLLGLVAALLNFIPFLGPIVSGTLAVLLAFTEGPQTVLYVAILALAIQQVEGNVMMPLVQRWAVQLPPALGVVGVVLVAGVFGVPGILFATPLVVVVMVLVKKLYVEDLLERN